MSVDPLRWPPDPLDREPSTVAFMAWLESAGLSISRLPIADLLRLSERFRRGEPPPQVEPDHVCVDC